MWGSAPPPAASSNPVEEILKNAASMVIAAVTCFVLWHLATVLMRIAEGAGKLLMFLMHLVFGLGKLLTGLAIVALCIAILWVYQSASPLLLGETLLQWYNVLYGLLQHAPPPPAARA